MNHPNRKTLRLKNFDYSSDGAYFITTCTQNREHFFGDVQDNKMVLNVAGKIVHEQWEWLKKYDYVMLDEFVVMPNHFHGILWIVGHDRVGNGRGCVGNGRGCVGNGRGCVGNGRDHSLHRPPLLTKIKPISELIGAFKMTSSKRIHCTTDRTDFAWQKSFYDRIIRDDAELNRIREYIWLNAENWENDRNNLSNLNGG